MPMMPRPDFFKPKPLINPPVTPARANKGQLAKPSESVDSLVCNETMPAPNIVTPSK